MSAQTPFPPRLPFLSIVAPRTRAPSLLARLISCGVLVLILVLWTATAASAEDGLIIDSQSRFIADPPSGELVVTQTFSLLNDVPPLVEDDQTTDSFFAEFRFLVLSGASEVVISTSSGSTIPQRLEARREAVEGSPSIELVIVELDRRLGYGESTVVQVDYVVPNGEARSEDPVRVTESYLAFPVLACCDPDRSSVHIEVPQYFSVDIEGRDADFSVSSERGLTILSQENIADPGSFHAFIFGRNDAELAISEVDIDGITVQVEAWPDDEEWAAFVADALTTAIPLLEREIGQPWPQGDALRIVETTTPYRFGYAGWYRHRDDVIEVGETLDERVLVHELTHAWFSDELFDSRWINEGLAEYFSTLVLGPPAEERPSRGSLFALPLSEWTRPVGVPTAVQDQQELFGYSASFSVMEAIAAEIGSDGIKQVLEASRRGEISFTAGDQIEADPDAWKSWQRFLDLIEERGGWDGAEELFRQWVTTPQEAAQLDVREQAHRQYDTFVDESDGWAPPVGLRSALTVWEFDEAVSLMGVSRDLLTQRLVLETEVAALDLPFPMGIQDSYEASLTAAELDATKTVIEEKTAGLGQIQEIADLLLAKPSRMQELGLQGRDLNAELAMMRDAWVAGDEVAMTQTADGIRAALEDAGTRGWRTALLVGLIAVGLLVILALIVTNRRRRLQDARAVEVNGHEVSDPSVRTH